MRQWLRHPWQTALTVVGVALGVGVVTAVDLANQSAFRAFRYAGQAVGGKATHHIVGGPLGLSEGLYATLKMQHRINPSAPVVEGYVDAAAQDTGKLRVVGIDPFAEAPFRTFSDRFFHGADLESFFTRPGAVMLLSSTARRLGVRQGDSLVVVANGVQHRIHVCGVLEPQSEVVRQGLESVVVADIATAQELLNSTGRITRIDLIIPEGEEGERCLQFIRGRLPPESAIVSAESRLGSLDRMTSAFRLNLTALSLLALVVGMFLIYNTTMFSVVRRRRLIGLLRAIGVGRREIFGMLGAETILIGVIGTALGLLFGIGLGDQLIGFVSRTINDLYFQVDVRSVALPPETFAKATILGICGTIIAAIPPALEATSAPPRAVLSRGFLEARARRLVPRAALAGSATILGGTVFLASGYGGVAAGFLGLFTLIVGYALVVPGGCLLLTWLLRPPLAFCFGSAARMAAQSVVVSLSRTSVAAAALVVAVSATLGMGTMVESFRNTVASWLESMLRADVYVTTAGTGTGRNKPPLDPRLMKRLQDVPEAAATSMTRRVALESGAEQIELLAIDMPPSSFSGYRFKDGDPKAAWRGFSTGSAVIVSEPFASRHRTRVGGSIRLRTRYGDRAFPVAGVFYDYGSDVGVVAMSRTAYIRFWGDHSVDGMGFYAREGIKAQELMSTISSIVDTQKAKVVSNKALKSESLSLFDRTFAITGVLRALTLLVAFVGILSSLMAIQLERAREFAVMRAIGMTPSQTFGIICGETGFLGTLAGFLSIPLGLMQALVLVHVINMRSFGWTMEITIDPRLILQSMALSVAAALLAGLYPAWRIAVTPPAAALKEEE